VPATAVNVVAIAAGGRHSLALKNDGTLLAWGRSNEGQIAVPYSRSRLRLYGVATLFLCGSGGCR
jgi:alpha-tubulin suppressor-like RCC1 family protein